MEETINSRIRKWRKQRGLTQAQLAEQIGMNSSTYSQCERSGNISCELLIKIAHILVVDIRELLFGNFYDYTIPKQEIPDTKNSLTPSVSEQNLLKIIRFLPKEDKKDIISYIDNKYKNHKYKN